MVLYISALFQLSLGENCFFYKKRYLRANIAVGLSLVWIKIDREPDRC